MSDEILDLFAEDEVLDHPDSINYEQVDSQFTDSFLSFLEKRKEYIKKYDSIRKGNVQATTSAQYATQELIEEYHDIIEDLEGSKNKIINAFSLGGLSKKEIAHHDYPTTIRNWHIAKSIIFYSIITGGISYIGLNLLGGSNPEFWTGSLFGKVVGFGSIFGIGTGVMSFVASKKGFNRRTVDKGKVNFIEKRLMKRVRQKEKALLNMTTEFYDKMPNILNGNFEIYQTTNTTRRKFILFGKKVPTTKKVLKDEYKGLPLIKRMKISKLLTKFKNLGDKTAELEERLEKQRARKAANEERIRREQAEISKQTTAPSTEATVEVNTVAAPERRKATVHRRHKPDLAPGTTVISKRRK